MFGHPNIHVIEEEDLIEMIGTPRNVLQHDLEFEEFWSDSCWTDMDAHRPIRRSKS